MERIVVRIVGVRRGGRWRLIPHNRGPRCVGARKIGTRVIAIASVDCGGSGRRNERLRFSGRLSARTGSKHHNSWKERLVVLLHCVDDRAPEEGNVRNINRNGRRRA